MTDIAEKLAKPKRFENDVQEKAFTVLREKFGATEELSLARKLTIKNQLDALNALAPIKLDATTAVSYAERFDHDACTASKKDKNPNEGLHVKVLKAFVKNQVNCNKLQTKVSKSDKVSEQDKAELKNCEKHPFSKADVDVALDSDGEDYIAVMCNKAKSTNVIKALPEFKGRFGAEEAFHCALHFAEGHHDRIGEMLADSGLSCSKPVGVAQSPEDL